MGIKDISSVYMFGYFTSSARRCYVRCIMKMRVRVCVCSLCTCVCKYIRFCTCMCWHVKEQKVA